MKTTQLFEFNTEAALGRIKGVTNIDRFSENPDVDTLSVPEDIWTVGGTLTYLTTAQKLQFVSSDANDTDGGTGARTISVDGLNGNYDQVSETITMNGTTRVLTENAYLRLHNAFVMTAGSNGGTVGTITIDTGAATPVQGQISVGVNRTVLSQYTVPRNHVALVNRVYVDTANADGARVQFQIRPFGGVFYPIRRYFSFQSHVQVNADGFMVLIEEKTDMKLVVLTVVQNNTIVIGGYNLFIFNKEALRT